MGAVPSSQPSPSYVTPSLKGSQSSTPQVHTYEENPRMVHKADIGCTGEDFGFEN